MRKHDIEAWALSIIDRVVERQPVEDSRVELKAEWIDAKKAARRIAGHANASHGEPALWLIGVNEKAGTVPGVSLADFANWYGQVVACFDELAPTVTDLNVPYSGVTVVALLFETDRAPYVVKGQQAGDLAREVPFRHGTRCDPATRSQLIRLLAPTACAPQVEFVTASLHLNVNLGISGKVHAYVEFTAECYIVQPQNQQSSFASHRTAIRLNSPSEKPVNLGEFSFVKMPSDSRSSFTSVSLIGTGQFRINGSHNWGQLAVGSLPPLRDNRITAAVRFSVPNCEREIAAECELVFRGVNEPSKIVHQKYWEYPPPEMIAE